MSLRDEFLAAKKTTPYMNLPSELATVNAAFHEFAHEIPARVAAAIRRLQAGASPYTEHKDLTVTALGDRHMYELDKRVFELLDKLPGYRQLVIAASDPAHDVALLVKVSEGYNNLGAYTATYTATIDPSQPFSESIATYRGQDYSKGQTRNIGKNPPDWVQHAVKPKLSLPRQAGDQP